MNSLACREALKLPSKAGLGCCSVQVHQAGKVLCCCCQFIIPTYQFDLAHTGVLQISSFCGFVSCTREVFGYTLVHNKRQKHATETLTILYVYISRQLFGAFLKQIISGSTHMLNWDHVWLFENCLFMSEAVKVFKACKVQTRRYISPKCMQFIWSLALPGYVWETLAFCVLGNMERKMYT